MFGIKKAALKLVGKAENGSGYQLFEDKEAGAPYEILALQRWV